MENPAPQIDQTPVETVPVASNTQSNRKLMVILATVAGLVVLGGVAYTATTFTGESLTVTPVISPASDSSKIDDTAGWKTYTNPKGEYSFKHPAGFTFNDRAAGEGQESIRFNFLGSKQPTKPGMLIDGYSFTVTKLISELTVKEIAQTGRDQADKSCRENTNPKAKISPITLVKIDTQQAWQFTISSCLVDSTIIYVANSSDVYSISLSYPGAPGDQINYKKTLDQILSTFKFTN